MAYFFRLAARQKFFVRPGRLVLLFFFRPSNTNLVINIFFNKLFFFYLNFIMFLNLNSTDSP